MSTGHLSGLQTSMIWVLLLALPGVLGLPAHPYRHAALRRSAPLRTLAQGPPASYLEQPLDQFDATLRRTWRQRYFVNASFFNGDGPVFLCVGGEGPGFQPNVVVDGDVHCGLMMTLAAKHRALVFALEHRYYGESVPVEDYSTPNLQWLSSTQALADLATFVGAMRERHGLHAPANRWLTFGGSYPGMLAAWARLKYPHLVYAAVSSSAPVHAVVNFQGYNDVVAESLRAASVGGSDPCEAAVRSAFAALGEALNDAAGRRRLEQLFDVCEESSEDVADLVGGEGPLDDVHNRVKFSEVAADVFPFQDNDMACTAPLCNYAKICTHMLGEEVGATGAEAALRRLASLNARRRNGDCVDASYATDVAGLTDVSLEGGDARVWFYQTCTEFGFYQVCDPDSQCPFTSSPWLNRLPTWFAQCELAYNISAAATEAFVARSNLWTGGRNPEGSRVLFVNGEVDPWKAASILTALPSHLFPTIEVRGASHHQWTHPPQPTDSAELLRAREDISRQVGAWLSDASGGSDEAHVLASAHRKIVA